MLCPLLGKCESKIPLDKYRDVCSNVMEDAYKKCDQFKSIAGGTKSPTDWEKLLRPTP
jgi:hypothetical protein